jgi:hypothetical protein
MARTTRIRSLYRIAGGPGAPAKARRIAAQELGGAESSEGLENASLLLGEITAERTELDPKGSSDPRLMIDVRQSAEQSGWCVIDRGQPALPVGLRSTALEEIADAWGVSRRDGLTHTWFKLLRNRTKPEA